MNLCDAAVHLILCAGDAHEEHKVGDEEADAEVQVDGVACALDGPHEVKCDNADEEADQRQRQPHQCDQTQLVYILVKRENEDSPYNRFTLQLECEDTFFSLLQHVF